MAAFCYLQPSTKPPGGGFRAERMTHSNYYVINGDPACSAGGPLDTEFKGFFRGFPYDPGSPWRELELRATVPYADDILSDNPLDELNDFICVGKHLLCIDRCAAVIKRHRTGSAIFVPCQVWSKDKKTPLAKNYVFIGSNRKFDVIDYARADVVWPGSRAYSSVRQEMGI